MRLGRPAWYQPARCRPARTPSASPAKPSSTGLLSDAGLAGATVETIDLVHEGDDLDELWHGLLGGSVRGAALVEAQGAETRERIRIEFDRLMDDLRSEGRYRIPIAVKLGSARKP